MPVVPLIPSNELTCQSHLIGAGSFAHVKKYLLNSSILVAVKEPIVDEGAKKNPSLEQELEILIALGKHPHIVEILGIVRPEAKPMRIVMQLALIDLRNFIIKSSGDLLKKHLFSIGKGIIKGLQFVHGKEIVHRDLKPENILLNDLFEPCITDFGFAIKHRKGELRQNQSPVGTAAYIAPEVWEMTAHDPYRADLYALGIVLNAALRGKIAESDFPGLRNPTFDDIIGAVKRGMRPTISKDFKGSFELIKALLSTNPVLRPELDTASTQFTVIAASAVPIVADLPILAVIEEDEENNLRIINEQPIDSAMRSNRGISASANSVGLSSGSMFAFKRLDYTPIPAKQEPSFLDIFINSG
jgi:serine/threonine protein kinase